MRLLNEVFDLSHIDAIGDAFNKVMRTSTLLMEWTDQKIKRTASNLAPKGFHDPYILTQLASTSSRFMPNGRERLEVGCGILVVWTEPFETLEEGDVTIVTVTEEIKRTLFSDPYLKAGGAAKTERLHGFDLFDYDAEEKDDAVTLYAAYQALYLVDLNYLSRAKQ